MARVHAILDRHADFLAEASLRSCFSLSLSLYFCLSFLLLTSLLRRLALDLNGERARASPRDLPRVFIAAVTRVAPCNFV